MFKRGAIVVVGFIFILISLVHAQETTETTFVDYGITPDSAFYFLDHAWEDLQLTLTKDPIKEAELSADFTAERFAEIHQMIQEDNFDAAHEASEEAHEDLQEFHNSIENIEATQDNIEKINEIEESAIKNDESVEEIKVELVKEVEAGTITQEIATSLEVDDLKEESIEVQENINDVKEEIKEDIAKDEGITKTEAEIKVEDKEEESGVALIHEEEIKEELPAVETALEEIKTDYEKALEEGKDVNKAAFESLIKSAELRLEVCESAFEEGKFGYAFGQLTAAEHLILNADKLLNINELSDQEKAQLESEINNFKKTFEETRKEIDEENKEFVEDYEKHKDEFIIKYGDKKEEFEKEYERGKKVLELAQKLSEKYDKIFNELKAQGKSDDEIIAIISADFAKEYENAYGEKYVPPVFESIIEEEEVEVILIGDIPIVEEPKLAPETVPIVAGAVIQDYTYTDPITGYKYTFREDSYEYETPLGVEYEEKYPEGFEVPKAYNTGDETHNYRIETEEGTVEYAYTVTGYKIKKPDGTTESFAYPPGSHEFSGGGECEIKATGFSYRPFETTEVGTREYSYNPKFDNYVSDKGDVYVPYEGTYVHDNVEYDEDEKIYEYEYEGEEWTYDPTTNAWKSGDQVYYPSATAVAPIGHEDQGAYTTSSGETWTFIDGKWASSTGDSYDPSTGAYTSSSGSTSPYFGYTYNSETHTYTTESGETVSWSYDSSTNTWTSSTGETHSGSGDETQSYPTYSETSYSGDSGSYSGGDSGSYSSGDSGGGSYSGGDSGGYSGGESSPTGHFIYDVKKYRIFY